MATASFGRLTRVELRNAWPSEAGHFTPWLAQEANLRLLGETIGVDLELEAVEQRVGPFRADILCKDTVTGAWVLVENQLARTDHTHLGQLLTYAAGLQTVTIVWIAQPFTEEHRAALDWLNQITDRRFNFFGIEIELWQIGDSAVAPKFNVVCQPNEWSRTVSEGASAAEQQAALTSAKQLQQAFWEGFRTYAQANTKIFRPTKAQPQHWMYMAIGRTGFRLTAIASFYNTVQDSWSQPEVRAEFVLYGKQAKEYFELLLPERESIESELGYGLVWHRTEASDMCRLYVRRDAALEKRDAWPALYAWLVEHLNDLKKVFYKRVQSLALPAPQDSSSTSI